MCERTRILGVDRDGGFAEYVAIPESVVWQNDRAKLPPEIATLQEPFGNAVFAVEHADLAGKTVAVLGCGPVGLFTIALARAFGAGRVFASDLVPFRLGLADRLGAIAIDATAVPRTRRPGSSRTTRASTSKTRMRIRTDGAYMAALT